MELRIKTKTRRLPIFFFLIAGISTGLLSSGNVFAGRITKEMDKTLSGKQDQPQFEVDTVITLEHELDADSIAETIFSDSQGKQSFLNKLNQSAGKLFDTFSVSKSLLNNAPTDTALLERPEILLENDVFTVSTVNQNTGSVSYDGDNPVLTVEETEQSPNNAGPAIYTGGQQNYVLRYVCCDDLPIISNPDLSATQLFDDDNVVAVPEQNELIAVFDDLPVYNGDQFFVRVQRSKGQHYTGWFPLFWLHQTPSPVTNVEINTGVSYRAMAGALRETAKTVFYENCNELNPAGGVPDWELDGVPGSQYACGELPIGDTSQTTEINGNLFRFLGMESSDFPSIDIRPKWPIDFPAFGFYAEEPHAPIELEVPLAIGELATQRRPHDDYHLESLDSPDQVIPSNIYSHSEYTENEPVRVHPADWHFKTRFSEDATGPYTEELEFTLRLNLPGVDIYSPWFDKEVVIWGRNVFGTYKESRISQIKMGGLRIDEIPLIVTGRVFIKDTPTSGGSFDSHFVNQNTRIGIEFTDVELARLPSTTFYDGIQLRFSSHDASLMVNSAIEYLRYALNQTLTSSLGSFAGSIYWFKFKGELETTILDTLGDLAPRLTHVFGTPNTRSVKACSTIVPPSYKSMTSPYYAFYRNCIQFAASLELDGFVYEPSAPVNPPYGFTNSELYWANVNTGGLRFSRNGGPKVYPCPNPSSDPTCYLSFEKPWWAGYAPQYFVTGDNQFEPESYSYASSTGGRVLYSATGSTVQHYWRFLQCLIPAADMEFNISPDALDADLGDRLAETCRLPALETTCALYGEGEDLEQMWDARWGYVPPLSGYLQYCAWAEELRNEGEYEEFSIEPASTPVN